MNPLPTTPAPDVDYSIPGMRIERTQLDGDPTLIVRTAAPRADWIIDPATVTERIAAAEAPTTLLYRGTAYRIREATEGPVGWTYHMTRLPEGETRLRTFDLSREAIDATTAQADAERRELKRHQTSAYWEFLVGWLPARFQNELSQRIEFSPADASLKNAYIEYLAGLVACILSLAVMIGGFMGGILNIAGPFSLCIMTLFVTLEGFIRYGHVKAGGEPLGLLLPEAVIRLYERLLSLRSRPT